jgi:hypothetical protein
MTKQEIKNIKQLLDKKVEIYFDFFNRDDYPDKPCVRKNVAILQNTVFTLAEFLHELRFITWEECCEYWSKVGFVDEFNENCKYENCGANINGICEYTKRGDNDESKI